MAMKDKLIKNHHKGIYYRMKNLGITTAVVLGVGFVVAVPTYNAIKASEDLKVQAQNEEVPEENEKEESEKEIKEVVNNLVSFTDGE